MSMSGRLLRPQTDWTPLKLSPYFAMLPGVGTFRAYTAAGGNAGDGDAVQQVVANTGQVLAAPSAAERPVWRANAGKPYLDFSSGKALVQNANFGLSGNVQLYAVSSNRRVDTALPTRLMFSIGNVADFQQFAPAFSVASNGLWGIWVGSNTGSGYFITASPSGNWETTTHRKTPGATNSTSNIRINGTAGTLSSSTSSTPNVTNTPLRLMVGAGGTRYGGGYLRDLVIFTTLATDDRDRTEAWITARRP